MKALHPSEHTIKTARVPGGNCMSVALACDMVQTIPVTSANSTATVTLLPDILIPASVSVTQGGTTTYGNFYNAAFGGTFSNTADWNYINSFMDQVTGRISNYRITSQSATVELIAPALSDQGTITAMQFLSPPKTMEHYNVNSANLATYPDLWTFPAPPVVSSYLMGTKGYTSKAREGVYMPLKLTDFDWKSSADRIMIYEPGNSAVFTGVGTCPLNNTFSWPFYYNGAGATGIADAATHTKFCGFNFGRIVVDGIAANVAIRVRIRQVVEITARPDSLYAPLMENSYPPDPTAMKMYYEISARMADGYPASYNDLGKLKDLILGIGKKVLPYVEPTLSFLSSVPGPIGAVASVAKTAAPVVKTIATAVKAKKAQKKALPAPQKK